MRVSRKNKSGHGKRKVTSKDIQAFVKRYMNFILNSESNQKY